jgi:tetratricopeptide (TPR) repeat protein
MRFKRLLALYAVILFAGLSMLASGAHAQGRGNSITGYVFGLNRQPLYDANVELLDDLNRFIQRQRTDGSGRYYFFGMRAGRYTIRVMPYETDYMEQEQSVEIVNFYRQDNNGQSVATGFISEQLDFFLRTRRGGLTGATGAVFVQDIPPAARKLYEKAVADLNDKKEKEGLAGLKSAIEVFPKYFYALERLGNEYVRLKHYQAAEILLKAALEVNPRSFRSWYGLAYTLNSVNRDAEALTAVQKAIEIYADSPEALLLSGVLLKQAKKFDEAEKHLVKVKELAKNKMPIVHMHLALLYGNDLKRYADAASELKLYLKNQPDLKDAENIKALIKTFEEKAAKK